MRNGWQTKTIGDVCEFQRGLTYAKGDEVDVSGNVVLRATNIDLSTNLLSFEELKYINDKVVVPESKKVRKGSLMICTASGSKSHLGKVAYIDDDYGYAFGGFMGMLTPLNELLPRYLFHLMTSEEYKDFIGALSDGANINNLTFDNLKRFPVPVPPLPEQRRIVGILDEAFEGIARAKANTEKNLQNARALFEGYLNSVFTQRGEGWVEKPMGEVVRFQGGSQPPKSVFSKEYKQGYIRLIQIRDYKSDNHVVYIPEKAGRRQCKADDVMIGRYGPPLFQILRGIDGAYNVALMKATPDATQLSKDYLYYFLKNGRLLAHVIHSSHRAAGQTGVRKETLEPYPIPFPKALTGQVEVVSNLEALYAGSQYLESIYKRKLAALEELKKSLLHRAFIGELVPGPPLSGVAK